MDLIFEYQDRDTIKYQPLFDGHCALRNRYLPGSAIIVDSIKVEDWENPIPCLIKEVERIKGQLICHLFNLQAPTVVPPFPVMSR
jgi:hypothetical protein